MPPGELMLNLTMVKIPFEFASSGFSLNIYLHITSPYYNCLLPPQPSSKVAIFT